MLIRDQIKQVLEKYLELKEWDISGWFVDVPKDRSNGDYSANIAFLLSKKLKQSPQKIADDIAGEIQTFFINQKFNGVIISSLRGFINFDIQIGRCYMRLNDKSFSKKLIESTDKILLEYVSANPTGPLHIGHGRWAALGDSLTRILKHVGYNVQTEFYINDAGKQIENLIKSVEAVKNKKELPLDGYAGDYIKLLVDSVDPVAEIRQNQEKTLKTFRVVFDIWYSEKESLHNTNEVNKVIEKITKDGLTYKDNNALFFRSTDYGDDKDRVLIKDNGEYTYFSA
ncbi:MAG: arginine--tRNA ligase, partial [Candidatus Margulisbacteria bacterium GWF2_35_9]